MSNRPRAVDFLNDEPVKNTNTFSDEEPVLIEEEVTEIIYNEKREFSDSDGEEHGLNDSIPTTLPSGAISKGIQ